MTLYISLCISYNFRFHILPSPLIQRKQRVFWCDANVNSGVARWRLTAHGLHPRSWQNPAGNTASSYRGVTQGSWHESCGATTGGRAGWRADETGNAIIVSCHLHAIDRICLTRQDGCFCSPTCSSSPDSKAVNTADYKLGFLFDIKNEACKAQGFHFIWVSTVQKQRRRILFRGTLPCIASVAIH